MESVVKTNVIQSLLSIVFLWFLFAAPFFIANCGTQANLLLVTILAVIAGIKDGLAVIRNAKSRKSDAAKAQFRKNMFVILLMPVFWGVGYWLLLLSAGVEPGREHSMAAFCATQALFWMVSAAGAKLEPAPTKPDSTSISLGS